MDRTDQTDRENPAAPRPWLRRFSYLVILATFSLIAIGGHVTSTDVGLAVPDGFTTFGYPTLLAPLSVWWDDFGTRWEHSHRLKGMVVGMMTIAIAIWLFNTQRRRTWLRWAGIVMLALVISQGVMGALRVSEISLTLAFVHGIVGQLILCSWVVVATALGGPWLARLKATAAKRRDTPTPGLRWVVRSLLILLLIQLTLGSAVRHFKADKAIPDFPLTYGHVLPPMSQDTLDERYSDYYAGRARDMGIELKEDAPIVNVDKQGDPIVALSDVDLQIGHRIGAVVVCVVGLGLIIAAIRRHGSRSLVAPPALTLLVLMTAQFALGVITVLTGTDPLLATLHQATGAALIAVATWLAVRIHLAEYAEGPQFADTSDRTPAEDQLERGQDTNETAQAAAPRPTPATTTA